MAEIPGPDYSHIHRSIDQLRSMNERGVLQLGPMSTTDIRASLMHDYKPFNIDLRNHGIDRLDYNKLANGIDLVGRGSGGGANNDVNTNNNNNNNNNSNARNNVDIGRLEQHQSHQQQQDQKAYSSPSTPPTPLSNNDGQMTETKVNIDHQFSLSGCLFFIDFSFVLF